MELSALKLSVLQRLLNHNNRTLFDKVNQLLDEAGAADTDELTDEQHQHLDESLTQLRNGELVGRADVKAKANKLLNRS